MKLVVFHGWTAGVLWQDTKFAVKRFNDIELLVIVGDSDIEKGLAVFFKPFIAPPKAVAFASVNWYLIFTCWVSSILSYYLFVITKINNL